ncbi:unnamed protein product [Toxocara canis]|uniref:Uncharacterized protein n=1 Tax=Toxocara canis TaxID=6265 RepID=A0A183UA84_TOXCA|nr:unnamed protein product [Toxocara canis]
MMKFKIQTVEYITAYRIPKANESLEEVTKFERVNAAMHPAISRHSKNRSRLKWKGEDDNETSIRATSTPMENETPIRATSTPIENETPIRATSTPLEKETPVRATSTPTENESPVRATSASNDSESPTQPVMASKRASDRSHRVEPFPCPCALIMFLSEKLIIAIIVITMIIYRRMFGST